MKTKHYLVAALAATMSLASCSSDDNGGVVDNTPKTVKVDVSKAFLKSRSEQAAIDDGDKVVVNNMQIYLNDGSTFYEGETTSGEPAIYYFDEVPTDAIDYHFVPAAANNVIVVGNRTKEELTGYTNVAAIQGVDVNLEDEQECAKLSLYGTGSIVTTGEYEDVHQSLVYKANVTLAPVVSRLEIEKFNYTGTDYTDMELRMVAFTNYNKTANLYDGAVGDATTLTVDKTNVYTELDKIKATKAWHWDGPAEGVRWGFTTTTAEGVTTQSFGLTDRVFGYNFFAQGEYPQVIVWLQAKGAAGVQNLYLVTNKFYTSETYNKDGSGAVTGTDAITKEAVKVYRATFNFDDSDLSNPEKCVDVTVTTAEWDVITVIPDFK